MLIIFRLKNVNLFMRELTYKSFFCLLKIIQDMNKLVMRRYLMMGAGQYLRDFILARSEVDSLIIFIFNL